MCFWCVCVRVVFVRARADMYADTGVDGNTVAVAGMGVSVDANAGMYQRPSCRLGMYHRLPYQPSYRPGEHQRPPC